MIAQGLSEAQRLVPRSCRGCIDDGRGNGAMLKSMSARTAGENADREP